MLVVISLACTPVWTDADTEPVDTEAVTDTEGAGSDTSPGGDDTSPGGDDTSPVSEFRAEGIESRVDEAIASLVYTSWTQLAPATVWVEYSFDGELMTTPALEVTESDTEVEMLLLGVPFGEVVSYQVVNDYGDGEFKGTLLWQQTGDLPMEYLTPEVHIADEENWYTEGKYLWTSMNEKSGGWTGGNYWAFIIDRKGRVVWAQETPDEHWTIYNRISLDGDDLMYDEATYWSGGLGGGEEGQIHRIKIDGSVVASYDAPGLHHAWVELPDGSLAFGSATSSYTEYLRIRDATGSFTDIWGCGEAWGSSYCQSNSLWYNEAADSFLYSFYTNSSLMEIDRQTGEEVHGWGNVGDWSFDPEESQFDWQHGATYTDVGTLLLSTQISTTSNDCVVREYTVNESANALEQVWNFATEDGIKCNTAGEAHRLPNGNTLHNYGSNGRTRETTSDGVVVWDVEWEGERLQGRGVWIEDLYTFAP